MNYFIIGDIHGCYYTFNNMIEKHWDKEREAIIQVGDLIDRGKHSSEIVGQAMEMVEEFPDQVTFLKGNHEYEMSKHFRNTSNFAWLAMGGSDTLRQYKRSGRDIEKDVDWMRNLPLFWENDGFFVSHAGIAEQTENPFIESDLRGVLWNRSRLKHLGKLQIVGHTPVEKPYFDEQSNTWNIDTGAVFSNVLTGMKVTPDGEVLEFVKEKTDNKDVGK